MLQQTLTELLYSYHIPDDLCITYWAEIEQYYSSKKRHYHNLTHLENLLNLLLACKSQIKDWDSILFALYYHDIIYNTFKKDNEERSALLAVKRLTAIHYAPGKCALCSQHILATKSHAVSKNNDTNLFTDADLSILGAPTEIYVEYAKQIRKEYSLYPDFMYKPGRKKVLQYFLQMERIFKTDYFCQQYEVQAKQNISAELDTL